MTTTGNTKALREILKALEGSDLRVTKVRVGEVELELAQDYGPVMIGNPDSMSTSLGDPLTDPERRW